MKVISRQSGGLYRMISEKEFIQLLEKHSAGDCTEAELGLMDEYLQQTQSPSSTDNISDSMINATFGHLSSAIDVYETRKHRRMKLLSATRIAASVLLVIGIATILYQKKTVIYNAVNPVAYTFITAKHGENVSVDLPDGSIVLLNQNSRLSYSNRYNDELREVSLTGEAYFRVAKNKTKPFIVHTGHLNTRVVGTSFNVEAYPFSSKIEVALITGKIWLTNDTKKQRVNYILTPNQAVSYDVFNGHAEKVNVANAENYIAWKDGKVRFSDAKLKEVVRRLNVTYRSRIVLGDSTLEAQRIYGEFGIGEDPAAVVKTICILIKAKYIAKPGGELIIYPAGQNK